MAKEKEPEEEKCDFCDLAVAVGTSLRICRKIGDKKKCKELEKKILNEEIKPKEFFKSIREMAKGHKEELELLGVVDEFLEEAGYGKSKGKKKGKTQ